MNDPNDYSDATTFNFSTINCDVINDSFNVTAESVSGNVTPTDTDTFSEEGISNTSCKSSKESDNFLENSEEIDCETSRFYDSEFTIQRTDSLGNHNEDQSTSFSDIDIIDPDDPSEISDCDDHTKNIKKYPLASPNNDSVPNDTACESYMEVRPKKIVLQRGGVHSCPSHSSNNILLQRLLSSSLASLGSEHNCPNPVTDTTNVYNFVTTHPDNYCQDYQVGGTIPVFLACTL